MIIEAANLIKSTLPSSCDPRFFELYFSLPEQGKKAVYSAFLKWAQNPRSGGLAFKPLQECRSVWTVRCGLDYRAAAVQVGNTYHWFYCGGHEDYNKRFHQWATHSNQLLSPEYQQQQKRDPKFVPPFQQQRVGNWYQAALRVEAMRRTGLANFEHPDKSPISLSVSWDHPLTAPRTEAWRALKRHLQIRDPRIQEHPAALGWRLVSVDFNAA